MEEWHFGFYNTGRRFFSSWEYFVNFSEEIKITI